MAIMRLSTQHITRTAVNRLAEMLGVRSETMHVEYEVLEGLDVQFDAVIESGSYAFLIEAKSSSSLGQVFPAIDFLKNAARTSSKQYIALLVVPYMSRSGREYCEKEGVAWLDLSGNAKIVAPGLFVNSTGHKNRFLRPGRVESAFGPRGSRVARRLLLDPQSTFRQRELAKLTGLNPAYVSRVVRKMIEMDLVERSREGVRVTNHDRLLDAWRDEYRFDRHSVTRGHVSAPVGESVGHVLDRELSGSEISYALTGLAAAWSYNGFAGYRLTTVYVESELSEAVLREVGFRRESRGANTWLVVPNDEGVFDGMRRLDGINCANPVQVYLDLKAHPERSVEAADELRRQNLIWDSENE